MEHGHYFERLGYVVAVYTTATISDSSSVVWEFNGGDFTFDMSRRKVCVSVPITSVLSANIVVRVELYTRQVHCKNATQPVPYELTYLHILIVQPQHGRRLIKVLSIRSYGGIQTKYPGSPRVDVCTRG